MSTRTPVLLLLSVGLLGFSLAAPWPTRARPSGPAAAQAVQPSLDAEVTDFLDEFLYSPNGNPIGVRLRFSIRFKSAGGYAPTPSLLPADESLKGVRGLRAFKMEVEPAPAPLPRSPMRPPYGRYQGGVVYHFTAEMLPDFYFPRAAQRGPCVSFRGSEEERAFKGPVETRFRIAVSGTKLDRFSGEEEVLTKNTYRLRTLYDAALSEGASQPCPF